MLATYTTKDFVSNFVNFRVSSKFEHKLLNGIIHRHPGKFQSKYPKDYYNEVSQKYLSIKSSDTIDVPYNLRRKKSQFS